MISKILNWLAINVLSRYVTYFAIENTVGEAYLRRWYLSRCNDNTPKVVSNTLKFIKEKLGIEFYLHNILLSDEDRHLHDHPWNFLSVVLSGAYSQVDNDNKITRFEAGSINTMDCHGFHRVVIEPNEEDKRNTWTLVIRSKNEKPWGFLVDGRGWVHHEEYLNEKFGINGWKREPHSYDGEAW